MSICINIYKYSLFQGGQVGLGGPLKYRKQKRKGKRKNPIIFLLHEHDKPNDQSQLMVSLINIVYPFR